MKIVFAGGGTGGHFYPIIAVAEKVNKVLDEENILGAKLYYLASDPFDRELLFENEIIFESITAGKLRTHPGFKSLLLNLVDILKTPFGLLNTLYKMFTIYPDVVFGKGGYVSFPSIFAARILRIPVLIHESDAAPGRVNRWAGKFAKKIALSFQEAGAYFPKEKTAWTGHPVRSAIANPAPRAEALKFFKLEPDLPIILVLGGSQGAELINNTILAALPELVKKYQIIHQVGVKNFKIVAGQREVILEKSEFRGRYLPIAYLSSLELKMAAGAANLAVSRAGSTLFEIASWGLPSILVPFAQSNADHARKNAFACAHAGAANVIEEANMTVHILISEIDRILENKEAREKMSERARAFHKRDAAEKIARELVNIALAHEK